MRLIDLTCSKCGATLNVNPDLKKCMCQYCGNEMLIDDEVIHYTLDNGYDFGYQSELGRQRFKDQLSQIDIKIDQVKKSIVTYTSRMCAYFLSVVVIVVLLIICNLIASGGK